MISALGSRGCVVASIRKSCVITDIRSNYVYQMKYDCTFEAL